MSEPAAPAAQPAAPGLAQAAALLDVGRPAAARERLGDLLAREPANAAALCLLARTYQVEDDFAGMRDAAVRAVEAEPAGYDGHLLLAFALDGLAEPVAATASAHEAIRLDPADWRGHAALAIVSVNLLGHRRSAFRSARVATTLAPDAAGAHYVRAQLFHAIGWTVPARRSYRRALALDPEHTPALTGLAQLSVSGGSLTAAAGHLDAVLSAAPADHAARTELDRLVLGGLAGWAIMAVWFAGFLAGLAFVPWLLVAPVLVLAVSAVLAGRTWRALSPGFQGYARRLLRSDLRARVRLAGLALCALTGAALGGTAVFQHQHTSQQTAAALLLPFGAHLLALMIAAVGVRLADGRVAAGTPRTAGSADADERPTDLLAEQRAASGAGRWAMRLARAGALFATVPWVMGIEPAGWSGRAIVGAVMLVAFLAYAEAARRWLYRRPGPPSALLGGLLVPLLLGALVELVTIVATIVLPPAAMPLPDFIAAPAFVIIFVGLVAWVGWLPYVTVRGLRRLSRRLRRGGPAGRSTTAPARGERPTPVRPG
jgi:Tfp pilus assembly protein PilF